MKRNSDISTVFSRLKEPRAADLKLGTVQGDLWHILYRYTNLLLFFVIVGFVMNFTHQNPSLIFSMNLLAIFPSSILLGVALKSMRIRYGGLIQAVLYMTFGNAVNLIASIILLRKRQIQLLQTALIGGILSNMHLMLGLGFLAGGMREQERAYNQTIASIFGSLLTLAVTGLVLPTASQLLAKPVVGGIVNQSRSISIIFIVVYFGLLHFQLRTHSSLIEDPVIYLDEDEAQSRQNRGQLGVPSAICIIALSTTLIGFNTYFCTNSLESLLNQTGLTTSFVGIVLLPLLTNDLEPIMAGYRGDMDLCLQATVGKCIQTTLFVIPVVVLIGWGMGIDEMTLNFSGFDVAALFSSALYIAFLTNNGKSNWFEGAALLAMFSIISISAYYIE
jgi:Ca2+:H+ antiporter